MTVLQELIEHHVEGLESSWSLEPRWRSLSAVRGRTQLIATSEGPARGRSGPAPDPSSRWELAPAP